MDFERFLEDVDAILNENEALIYDNYNDKEDQVLLDKALVDRMKRYLREYIQNDKLVDETLKHIVRELFELERQDIVIFKNGYIFIKYVSTLEQNIPAGRQNSHEARYNGFDEKELIAFYNEFCEQEAVGILVKKVAKKFVTHYILHKNISHEEYEKKVFSYIKDIFFDYLVETYENDDEFMLGFAGYIFRINFENVFLHIADLLLEAMAHGNQKVVNFIEYYTHDVIIIGGAKYKVPAIETKGGYKWKVVSILSIARVYINAKENIQSLKTKIERLQEKAKQYTIGGTSPIERQRNVKNAIARISDEIQEKLKNIEKYYDVIIHADIPAKQKQELKQKINFEKNETEKLKDEKERYKQMLLPEHLIMQYQKNQRELDSLKRELQNKLRVLKQNEQTYEEIKQALVKALIQKKKKL